MSDSKAQIRAEKAAAKAHGKALRPWYKKKRFILPLGLLAIIIIAAAAGGGGGDDNTSSVAANSGGTAAQAPAAPAASSSAAETSSPAAVQAQAAGNAADDVKVNSCTSQGALDLYQAELTVTNSSNDAATYSITISANDANGNRVGELNGFANAVAPGQSATVQAVGSVTGDAATCVVANATRF